MTDNSLEDAFHRICASEAPLSERLSSFSEAVRQFGRPFAEVYDDLIERIRSGEAGEAAPKPGDVMPAFLLPDGNNQLVSLETVLKDGPAVISFNRGHWCEYCLIELAAFREALNEFARTDAQVVSIMPEAQNFISQTQHHTAFPILSDIDNGYALVSASQFGSAKTYAGFISNTACIWKPTRAMTRGSYQFLLPLSSAGTATSSIAT